MAAKVIRFIQDYIARHQDHINSVAGQLGVPPTAIAAAISEEMSHVYSEGAHRAVVKNLPDAPLDYLVEQRSHDRIHADFEARRSDIENGVKPSLLSPQKVLSPTANDIGPANLNLGTAILTLQRYLANKDNAADPLNLKQYANDYQKLAKDIIDLNSPTTVALAGLYLQQGVAELTRVFGPNFTNASDVDQAALLTTFFKQGAPAFLRRHPPSANTDALGSASPTFPTPRPADGDGAPFVIDNFQTLKDSLSRKQGANDPPASAPSSPNQVRTGFASSDPASTDVNSPRDATYVSPNASSLRTMLEQRGANLGIAYAPYMSTDALLAEIHTREGEATQPQDADAVADRIEREIDMIGVPFVTRPEAADPPPLGLEPLTRANLDQRAARFGLRFGPAVPDHTVLAAVHTQEGDAAPPAAADALGDRMEREIDQIVTGAGVPWTGGDDMEESDA